MVASSHALDRLVPRFARGCRLQPARVAGHAGPLSGLGQQVSALRRMERCSERSLADASGEWRHRSPLPTNMDDRTVRQLLGSRCAVSKRCSNRLLHGLQCPAEPQFEWVPDGCTLSQPVASSTCDHLRGKQVLFVGKFFLAFGRHLNATFSRLMRGRLGAAQASACGDTVRLAFVRADMPIWTNNRWDYLELTACNTCEFRARRPARGLFTPSPASLLAGSPSAARSPTAPPRTRTYSSPPSATTFPPSSSSSPAPTSSHTTSSGRPSPSPSARARGSATRRGLPS